MTKKEKNLIQDQINYLTVLKDAHQDKLNKAFEVDNQRRIAKYRVHVYRLKHHIEFLKELIRG